MTATPTTGAVARARRSGGVNDQGQVDDTRPGPLAVAALGAAVALGVALRFFTTSHLWLDEALSVNIAALPIPELFDALRRDGAPPLYYVFLHGWLQVFGEGDLAVRALSGVISVAALPLAWGAGMRLGGRPAARAALVISATSPFAIRYATETRMYALVALLVLGGYVLVHDELRAPRAARVVAIAVVSGLLALTHYWSFYLLFVVATALGVRWWRGRGDVRRRSARVLLGIAGGALVFAPWLPNFLYQSANTGTPWGTPAGPVDVVITTFTDFGGGRPPEGRLLGILLLALVVLALTGRAVDRRRIEIDLTTRPGARAEGAVVIATLAVAIVAGYLTASAFASRYTSVVFPLAVLVAACGTRVFADARVRVGILLAASVLGLAGGVRNALAERTQAAEVAAYVNAEGEPGDVVVYCPDQLGPGVHRLLEPGFVELTFPGGGDPAFVDWVDYADRNRAGRPREFAAAVEAQAAPGADVFLVWMSGYRTLGERCEALSIALGQQRPSGEIVVLHDRDVWERHNLSHFPAP